jgi:hypothetical protein
VIAAASLLVAGVGAVQMVRAIAHGRAVVADQARFRAVECRILNVEPVDTGTDPGDTEYVVTYEYCGPSIDLGCHGNLTGYDGFGSRAANSSWIDRIRENRPVPCWLDPRDPERSVLVPGYTRGFFAEVGVWALLLVSGALVALFAMVARRPPDDASPAAR